MTTTREDVCQIRCFLEPNCLSYNVGPLGNIDKYLCEISDSNDILHPGDLVQRLGFTYQGTKVLREFALFTGDKPAALLCQRIEECHISTVSLRCYQPVKLYLKRVVCFLLKYVSTYLKISKNLWGYSLLV